MVLTGSFVLSSVTGLFCHRRLRTCVVSAPGRADITSANLTPASGRQDHTTSPYAAIVPRPRAVDRSQIFRPALRSPSAQNAAASTATHPAFRDDHDTPLWWGGMARACRDDLPDGLSEIFLQRGIDTPFNKPPDGQITNCAGWVEPAKPIISVNAIDGYRFAQPILRATRSVKSSGTKAGMNLRFNRLRSFLMSRESSGCGFPPTWCRTPRRGRRHRCLKTRW